MNEWAMKMWYVYLMEHYSAIKKNKIISLAGKWMELEIILREISHSERQISHVFSHMWNLERELLGKMRKILKRGEGTPLVNYTLCRRSEAYFHGNHHVSSLVFLLLELL
jgi:hypothetical protein